MRHDPRGRASRGDADRHRRPADGFRARDAERFRRLAEDALAALPGALGRAAAAAAVDIEAVPVGEVALADYHRSPSPGRLVLYRRPIEMRAVGRADLVEVIHTAAGQAIARTLGIEDDFPELWQDW